MSNSELREFMIHPMRRQDKEIKDEAEVKAILSKAKHITIAMSLNDEPYLVTLSHGYDQERNSVYFHCAKSGKKVEILRSNPLIWGQAMIDNGYQQGSCDHLFETAQFHGRVTFVEDHVEKVHALEMMIRHLDENPEEVIAKQITPHSTSRILVGRIDIDYISGKKADRIIIQV